MAEKRRAETRRNTNASKYYSQSSSALNLNPKEDYEVKLRKKVAKRKAVKIENVGQTKAMFSAHTMVTAVLIFVVALAFIVSAVVLYSAQAEVDELNKQLKAKHEENLIAEAEIANHYDIKNVEYIATTKLNMAKPNPKQIIHMNVPSQTYIVNIDEQETTVEKTSVIKQVEQLLLDK